MSDSTYVGSSVKSFSVMPQFDGYSRVVLKVSDQVEYVSGDPTGRTLTVESPWGSQAAANLILARVRGFQYQPYRASGALVDPAAELGDGITVNAVYSGLYAQQIRFGRLCLSEVSAPTEEVVDHEYPYVPKQTRKTTRELRNLSAQLVVQADLISAEVSERISAVAELTGRLDVQASEISAKVSQTGGSGASFGWSLTDSSWTIHSRSSEVLKVTKEGLSIAGEIVATSGTIGGFDIENSFLSYNNQTWEGTNSSGIYLGTQGIQLGKNFKVDASGNLTAASGVFTGSVRAGSIMYGDSNGTLPGAGIKSQSISGGSGGQVKLSTLTTQNLTSGINTSLGFADFSNNVFNGVSKPAWIKTKRLSLGNFECGWTTLSYVDHNGKNRTIRVVAGQ